MPNHANDRHLGPQVLEKPVVGVIREQCADERRERLLVVGVDVQPARSQLRFARGLDHVARDPFAIGVERRGCASSGGKLPTSVW